MTRLSWLPVGPAAALIALFGLVSPTSAATIFYKISDVHLSGIFGTMTGGGTFDSKGHSSVTINEGSYTYTLSGHVDGAGWNNIPSQQPPTLCILAGCDPFGAPIPGTPEPFSFGVNLVPLPFKVGQTTTVAAYGEDNLELFSGPAKITLVRIAGVPEPSAWGLMLLGAGLLGAGLRIRPKPSLA